MKFKLNNKRVSVCQGVRDKEICEGLNGFKLLLELNSWSELERQKIAIRHV